MNYFCAIDVGTNGAIAIGSQDLAVYDVFDMPDTSAQIHIKLKSLNEQYTFKLMGIEKQVPASGRTSSFSLGGYYKELLMLAMCLGIPHIIIPPKKWQSLAFDGGKKRGKDIKIISVSNASRRFPDAKLYGPKGGKLDGRADALNMLLAVIKEYKGE